MTPTPEPQRGGDARDAQRPWLSVIIPALDEAERVGRAIDSARAADASSANPLESPGASAVPEGASGDGGVPGGVEVIVVDGGSRDATRAEASAHSARVLAAPPGRGGQMNAGAKAARGRVLLFLHADTVLPAGYADAAARVLAEPGVVAGAFGFRLDAAGWRFRVVEVVTNFRARFRQMPYGDQAIFMTAERFAQMGGYADVPIMEDFDLILRLRRRGRVRIAPLGATTSARKCAALGLVRTVAMHQCMILAFVLGVAPQRIRWLCRWVFGAAHDPDAGDRAAAAEPDPAEAPDAPPTDADQVCSR